MNMDPEETIKPLYDSTAYFVPIDPNDLFDTCDGCQ